jgi:hypothetical protein
LRKEGVVFSTRTNCCGSIDADAPVQKQISWRNRQVFKFIHYVRGKINGGASRCHGQIVQDPSACGHPVRWHNFPDTTNEEWRHREQGVVPVHLTHLPHAPVGRLFLVKSSGFVERRSEAGKFVERNSGAPQNSARATTARARTPTRGSRSRGPAPPTVQLRPVLSRPSRGRSRAGGKGWRPLSSIWWCSRLVGCEAN